MEAKKILKSSSGATLLEGLIVGAIIGINALGVMYVESTLSKERARQRAFDTVSFTGRMIQKVMGNRAVCTLTIRNNPINQPFAELSNGTVDPNDLDAFIPINEPLIPNDLGESVSIKEYRILNDARNFHLEVTYAIEQANNQGQAVGFDELKRRYLLNTKLDPLTNTFDECQSEEKNQIESVADLACESIVKGEVDADEGGCVPPNPLDDPPDPGKTDCGPGASYKLVRQGNQFQLECKPCVSQAKFAKWKCEKGKFPGVNWVNVCYYRTVGCEGSVDGLHQSDDDMFFMMGPTKAKGGDTGTRKRCKKRRRNCPGEKVDPLDAEKVALESLEFAELHFVALEREYQELLRIEKETKQRNDEARADFLNVFSDVEYAAEGVFRAYKAESKNKIIKAALDKIKKIQANAQSIKDKVFK